jgi:hypothetical protein
MARYALVLQEPEAKRWLRLGGYLCKSETQPFAYEPDALLRDRLRGR